MVKKETVPLQQARYYLTTLWLVGSGVIFLITVAQSIGSVYQGQIQELWGWLLPTLLPTLSLMLSVLGASALETQAPARREKIAVVRRDFYSIALSLSWVHLGLILITIIAQPAARYFVADQNAKAIDVLKVSSLWLTPVQSLVVAAIGVLFLAQQGEKSSDTND